MNPILRLFIGLVVAWLFGLVLIVVSLIRQRSVGLIFHDLQHQFVFPPEVKLSGIARIVQKLGTSVTSTAPGLVIIVLVVTLVLQLLPPPPSIAGNASRIEALEKWVMKHDSLHGRIP